MTSHPLIPALHASSSTPPADAHRALRDYLVLPKVHERLSEIVWADALSRDRAERLGTSRVATLRKCKHLVPQRGCDLVCELHEDYLVEDPRFTQDSVKTRDHLRPGVDEELLGSLDLYLRGGWSFRYRRSWTHFERPHFRVGTPWEPRPRIVDPSPNDVRLEDRFFYEIGVFVMLKPFSAVDLCFERVVPLRRTRPEMRQVVIAPFDLDAGEQHTLAAWRIPSIRPGTAFTEQHTAESFTEH